jgi:hypothetical protein
VAQHGALELKRQRRQHLLPVVRAHALLAEEREDAVYIREGGGGERKQEEEGGGVC